MADSSPLLLFLSALEHILHGMGHTSPGGAAAAAMEALTEAAATP